MEITGYGKELIKSFEGCRLTPYKDTAGYLTVGYGHLTNNKNKITQAQAEKFFEDDVLNSVVAVDGYLNRKRYSVNQYQFDALVSFHFNIGNIEKVTGGGTRSLSQIADAMLKYVNAGGKFVQGLYERRKIEREYFLAKNNEDLAAVLSKRNIKLNNFPGLDIKPEYTIGKTYTTRCGLYVRDAPKCDAKAKLRDTWTEDGRRHDKFPENNCLDAGTRVSVLDVIEDNEGRVWLKIPSGYICGINTGGQVYVN